MKGDCTEWFSSVQPGAVRNGAAVNNRCVTADFIGADGQWSDLLLGMRSPGRPEVALVLSIGVPVSEEALVDRIVVVITHPSNVVARVQVADEHLPVEVLFRAEGPESVPGKQISASINVVAVGGGQFPLGYRVLGAVGEAAEVLAEVHGRAHQDLRCEVLLPGQEGP